jgi:predicted DNA-binding transcriptional regulator YafY
MPPLLVDDDEAVAIAVGLRAAAGYAVAGIEESSVRALAKLEHVLPAKLRRRVRVLGTAMVVSSEDGPSVDPEVLTALAAAVTNRERVRFAYRGGTGVETRRHVEPAGLVTSRRRWYLVGYDIDRDGWRIFHLDRVERPHATGALSTPRELPATDPAAYVAGHRTDWGTPTFRVSVTIQAPAGQIIGRLGDTTGEVTAIDDNSCRLDATRDDAPEWLAHRVIGLGVDFQVHEPPALIAQLRAIAARIDKATGAP